MSVPPPPSPSAEVIPFPEQERYFKVRRSFVQSFDFMAMPSHAQAIYFHMSANFNGWNNGRIEFSQRNAEAAAHISGRTARRELKRIEDAGFAVRTFKGSFDFKTGAAKPSTWYLPEFDRKLPTGQQGPQDHLPTGHHEPDLPATRAPISRITTSKKEQERKEVSQDPAFGGGDPCSQWGADSKSPSPSGTPKNSSELAFVGEVIRVSRYQVAKWEAAFPMVPDVVADLAKADAYYAEHPPPDGKWFFQAASWLERTHRKNLESRAREIDEDSF
jgi:hypothetical protein